MIITMNNAKNNQISPIKMIKDSFRAHLTLKFIKYITLSIILKTLKKNQNFMHILHTISEIAHFEGLKMVKTNPGLHFTLKFIIYITL